MFLNFIIFNQSRIIALYFLPTFQQMLFTYKFFEIQFKINILIHFSFYVGHWRFLK